MSSYLSIGRSNFLAGEVLSDNIRKVKDNHEYERLQSSGRGGGVT